MVQKFDARKIYKLSNEVIFFAPFLSVSPFLLLNLVRRILGDPGTDKGGEGKSKRAKKYIWHEEK